MNKSDNNASLSSNEQQQMLKKTKSNKRRVSLQASNGGLRLKFSNDDNGWGLTSEDS